MVKTTEQLTADIETLTKKYNSLVVSIQQLQSQINGRPMLSDLSRSEANLTQMMNDQSAQLDRFEIKLSKIGLPDEPRLYLNKSDIDNFQSMFGKLLAMMTTFEQLYDNLVAYTANNLPTVQ